METRGRHVIAELDGCDAELLSDPGKVRRLLLAAADEAGATSLAVETFEFPNGGVSGFVLLAESHISIHTWPEQAYAAIDIYTCGHHALPDEACRYLAARLGAAAVRVTAMDRGVPLEAGRHGHYLSPWRGRAGVPDLAPAQKTA